MSNPDPSPVSQGSGKAIASVVGGAVSVILLYLINRFIPPPPLPDYIDGAIQTLIVTAATYYTPHTFLQRKP